MRRCDAALLIGLLYGCRASGPAANPAALDTVATRYVTLALGLGRHDPNYVDAYYGPPAPRAARWYAWLRCAS